MILHFGLVCIGAVGSACVKEVVSNETGLRLRDTEETVATIEQNKAGVWKCTNIFESSDRVVAHLQVLDDGGLIIVTRGGLVLSLDRSGKIIKQRSIEVPETGYVSAATITSSSYGLIAVNVINMAGQSGDHKRSIVYLTSDRGNTWHREKVLEGSEISSAAEMGNGSFLLIGRHRTTDHRSQLILFRVMMAKSTEWTDLQDPVTASEIGGEALSGISNGQVLLLGASGNIYSISGTGQVKLLNKVPDDRPQTYFGSIIASPTNDSVIVVGGANSREGVWGAVSAFSNGKWSYVLFPNTYLSHGLRLSPDELVIGGYQVRDPNESVENRDRKSSLLFSSHDKSHWQTVCPDMGSFEILDLTYVQQNMFFVVTDNGITRVERSN